MLYAVSEGLIERERVQELQEKMEDLLIDYVSSQPHIEDRVTGELLLRLSEVERICQMIREQVILRQSEGRLGRYPLLMELFQDKPSWLYWQLTSRENSADTTGRSEIKLEGDGGGGISSGTGGIGAGGGGIGAEFDDLKDWPVNNNDGEGVGEISEELLNDLLNEVEMIFWQQLV